MGTGGTTGIVASSTRSVVEVTRHVPPPVQNMLWGRAAGRCEFTGCNKPLWKSHVTQEQVNIAQQAHIYAFSEAGPRGHADIPLEMLNSLRNLMLVCYDCHRKIDAKAGHQRYPASRLREMKCEHEQRIERVTRVAFEKQSHILLYGANIGDYSSPLNYQDAAAALFPKRYPAEDRPLELSTVQSSWLDKDPAFWEIESTNLRRKFRHAAVRHPPRGDLSTTP